MPDTVWLPTRDKTDKKANKDTDNSYVYFFQLQRYAEGKKLTG